MIYALAILIITAAVCYALTLGTNRGNAARVVALVGAAAALATALWFEGLRGGGIAGSPVAWPDFMSWLGASFYTSDTLAASLGAWCILLGGLCLLAVGDGEQSTGKIAAAVSLITVLYSLVYTSDLRAFAAQVLLVLPLTWAVLWDPDGQAGLAVRQRTAQAAGALALLVAVLLIGRTTGGIYGLGDLSLSALTFWPLLLMFLFILFWLGLAPFTGWSGLANTRLGGARGTQGALVQGLVLGVPALVLVLRLEALITRQALAGSVPAEWTSFAVALAWLGGVTAIVAAASAIVWAGTARWSGALIAFAMGIALWAMALDTPTGRYASIAVLLAYGLGRLTLDLPAGQSGWLPRLAAGLSLVGAPLLAGFVGIWLLATGLVESRHAALALVIAGAAIMAACGAALHLPNAESGMQNAESLRVRINGLIALILSAAIFMGGALPGLWLPLVEDAASIAGGAARIGISWIGIESGGMLLPLTLLAGAAVFVAGLGWLLRAWAKSRTTESSVLLPTAIARLQNLRQDGPAEQPLLSNPPPAIWWLSLAWLDSGIYGAGALLNRLAMRFGMLLARLEGRYYFSIALILTLLIILAVSR
jgi:hypothetical protein